MRKLLPILIVSLLVILAGCRKDLDTLTIGSEDSANKVLISGDRSKFKDAVLKITADNLEKEGYYIKLTGLDSFDSEKTTHYGAVVLVNTCWAGNLDSRVNNLLKKTEEKEKIIIFTSVGVEDWQPDVEVDTITSASRDSLEQKRAEELTELIKKKFNK